MQVTSNGVIYSLSSQTYSVMDKWPRGKLGGMGISEMDWAILSQAAFNIKR